MPQGSYRRTGSPQNSKLDLVHRFASMRPFFRDAPDTAGNSMTSSERPFPAPLLKKEASPAVLGGENSGNALEASNALNYRAWGIPAALSRGIPGNAPKPFPGSFRNFSGISSGKCQPYWRCGPSNGRVFIQSWR